jgi:hypothetical protein
VCVCVCVCVLRVIRSSELSSTPYTTYSLPSGLISLTWESGVPSSSITSGNWSPAYSGNRAPQAKHKLARAGVLARRGAEELSRLLPLNAHPTRT